MKLDLLASPGHNGLPGPTGGLPLRRRRRARRTSGFRELEGVVMTRSSRLGVAALALTVAVAACSREPPPAPSIPLDERLADLERRVAALELTMAGPEKMMGAAGSEGCPTPALPRVQ